MPIYEYSCEKCGSFEVTQKISEPALKKHPECGGKARRLISASSFALKGGGWYSDLYGGSKKPSGEKKSGGDGSGGKSAA
jgi:putative FmdB family regulatory protein